jgi:DNA-binding FrmR family transcriptional regulator
MKSDKKTIALSIKKSIGTLNKVMTMIDEDFYCADIAQQINAAM